MDISNALCKFFERLDRVKDKDLVLVLGNYKSGRSTTLSYIAFGPEMLEMKKRTVKDFDKKNVQKEVVSQKDYLKRYGAFEIGHDWSTNFTKAP